MVYGHGTHAHTLLQHELSVEVLELTLHGDIYLVMGAQDSKGGAGEP